jgi:hypothetical protein
MDDEARPHYRETMHAGHHHHHRGLSHGRTVTPPRLPYSLAASATASSRPPSSQRPDQPPPGPAPVTSSARTVPSEATIHPADRRPQARKPAATCSLVSRAHHEWPSLVSHNRVGGRPHHAPHDGARQHGRRASTRSPRPRPPHDGSAAEAGWSVRPATSHGPRFKAQTRWSVAVWRIGLLVQSPLGHIRQASDLRICYGQAFARVRYGLFCSSGPWGFKSDPGCGTITAVVG